MAQRDTAGRKKKLLAHYSDVKNGCSITNAANHAGVNRRTYIEWRRKDAAFDKACEEAEDAVTDWVESQLCKQIQDGSTAATIFFLCNKGKRRGWQHVQKIEHRGDQAHVGVLVEIVESDVKGVAVKQLGNTEQLGPGDG